jgi:hypothetical protein
MKADYISGPASYLNANGIKGLARIKFWLKIYILKFRTRLKLGWVLLVKEVYVGPFKGEFGNFLGHTLPFLMFLHKKGVKIHFCGFEILAPFLVDDKGNSIVKNFYGLRDLYKEAPPTMNSAKVPVDVEKAIIDFKSKANNKWTYFDLDDAFFYFFIYRQFVAEGHSFMYDLSKVYKSENEYACAIFPRAKGAEVTKNNGEAWNYQEVIDVLKPVFSKVYVVGHPAHVLAISNQHGVEVVVSSDNLQMLKACSNAQCIISPHSGVVYLAPLLRKRFILLYKGGNKIEDIGSIQNTRYYLNSLSGNDFVQYCFSLEELKANIKTI